MYKLAGYDVKLCVQPARVGESLRYLVAVPALFCLAFSLVLLYMHPINEAKRKEIREELPKFRSA